MPKYALTITTAFDHQSYQKMVAWPFMKGMQRVRNLQFTSTVHIVKWT